MLNFLGQIVDGVVFLINHLVEMILFIPRLLGMFIESMGLIRVAIDSSPTFLAPILSMMLAVAAVMWLVTLL